MSTVDEADVSVFVPVDAVFPETAADENTIRQLLASFPRDEALMWCARINTLVSGFGPEPDLTRQRQVIAMLCTAEHQHALEQFAAGHGGVERLKVFFRGQMLELARHAATFGQLGTPDGLAENDPTLRSAFFKAALIASGLWEQRLFGPNGIAHDVDADAQLAALLGAFRKNIEEANRAPIPGALIARSWHLFHHYLPQQQPRFAELFHEATSLTLDQYFVCAAALLARTFSNGMPFFTTNYVADDSAFKAVFARFVSLQSQSPEEWVASLAAGDAGHRALRMKPVWSLPGARSVISDPTFFIDNLAPAPLFQVIASRPAGLTANELFSAFGSAFETYALDLLARRYPAGAGVLMQRLHRTCRGSTKDGTAFEVDALLNDLTAAVVFEMKAAWLREETILSGDARAFHTELRQKYGYEPSSRERGKGVAQLARSIGALARREWLGPRDECAAVRTLYPVLTVYDARMGAPGSAHFLEQDFRTLLGSVPKDVYVHPLIIMTIDDLEHLVFSVENLSLREVLHAYSLKDAERVSSLHNFIAHSPFASQIHPNPLLGELLETLMSTARTEILGAMTSAPI